MGTLRLASQIATSIQIFGCLLWIASMSAFGQGGGRFEELKRQAATYLENGQYDRAGAKLEEVWEQDQSDAWIAEGLAIAYLNGENRRYHQDLETRVPSLLQQAIRLGGSATFLVQHSHEKFVLQSKTINDYCSGKLSIAQGRLTFIAQARKGMQEHSFDVAGDAARVAAPDENGAFQIKTKSGNYTIVPRTRIKRDSDLIVSLTQEHLGTR